MINLFSTKLVHSASYNEFFFSDSITHMIFPNFNEKIGFLYLKKPKAN